MFVTQGNKGKKTLKQLFTLAASEGLVARSSWLTGL
jgi:hypothetical protein